MAGTRSRRKRRYANRLLMCAVVCLSVFAKTEAQDNIVAVTMQIRSELNSHWRLRGEGRWGRERGNGDGWVMTYGAGVGYNLSKEAVIAIYARAALENYRHMQNRDAEISVAESITWKRSSGIFFGFCFEQRRLFYQPSGYTKNVSFCGGIVGVEKTWEKTGLSGNAACQVTCNMRSPNTKAEFVQRIRIPITIRKKLTDNLALGACYTYSAMGDKQVYIADRNNLHSVSANVFFTL